MIEILRSALFLPLLVACGFMVVAVLAWLRSRRQVRQLRDEQVTRGSELDQLENRLNQARRMEAVGILAGSIVNNLNNLLAVIMGHTRMASHDLPSTSTAHEELERVMKAGHMASDLVRERPCGPVLVTATGVQQVLMNLCSNSLNAMYSNQGTLEISLTEEVITGWHKAVPQELGPGSYVRLSVRDNGKGMDKDTLNRIFESYFTDNGDGNKMGIGLSTVYRILEDHDGVTIARSEIGQGTTFDIFFPMIAWSMSTPTTSATELDQRPAAESRGPALASVTRLPGPAEPEVASGQTKATVLLVDDEEMVSQVLTRGLQRLGYRVVAHNDSRTALADFAQTPEIFDVVVTDQIMPHMSGVRLTRKIHDLRADVPIVLFTGFRDSFNEIQAREAGVSEFILKPASHRDLADLIDRVVMRREEGRG